MHEAETHINVEIKRNKRMDSMDSMDSMDNINCEHSLILAERINVTT